MLFIKDGTFQLGLVQRELRARVVFLLVHYHYHHYCFRDYCSNNNNLELLKRLFGNNTIPNKPFHRFLHRLVLKMPYLDRTNEILSIIQNQQQKKQYEASHAEQKKKDIKKKQTPNAILEFNEKAKQISKELQDTADLLQKLTKRKFHCYFTCHY